MFSWGEAGEFRSGKLGWVKVSWGRAGSVWLLRFVVVW